jgi:septum formation protein
VGERVVMAGAQRLVLGSGSPRRRELLSLLGLPFDVVPADVDETPEPGEDPVAYVRRLAQDKSTVVWRTSHRRFSGESQDPGPSTPELVVVAADTTVALAGEILAKPTDAADAARMLRALAGRPHQVHTGVGVCWSGGHAIDVVTTEVVFDALTDAEIARYIASGEPMDKAGAYAIQGGAAGFVREVHGSVTNVVGLPLAETRHLLRAAGLPV